MVSDMNESCKCGKYKKCVAEGSLSVDDKGQININSIDWFKCYDFKSTMKGALNLTKEIVSNE